MKKKDNKGYYTRFECPLCREQMSVSAITCEENPNYSEFECSKHGLVKVFKNGQSITLFDRLERNCMEYIALLNVNDASINRVVVHESIAKALGLKHHDKNLQEITDNLDEHIGVPIEGFANPMRFGRKLYKLLLEKFVKEN